MITMTRSGSVRAKIPTESPQPFHKGAARAAGRPKAASSPALLAGGTGRAATRGGGEVIELEYGITVYPARSEGGRWRAVWHEDGERRQCEAATEEKLAPKLAKVAERLQASPSISGGRAGTQILSVGCASGSPSRLSPRSAARTSRPSTLRRSSTPRRPQGKATGFIG